MILLSFFKVDVWMISVPFAIAKLVFDLAWDYYRYKTGRLDKTQNAEPMEAELKRVMSIPNGIDRGSTFTSVNTVLPTSTASQSATLPTDSRDVIGFSGKNDQSKTRPRNHLEGLQSSFSVRFHTLSTALPRLPFALIPFAFSQFILIEGLAHQGWIDVFAQWLVKATNGQLYPTIWIIGVLGVLLCNFAGTNIGATILLTEIVRAAPGFPGHSTRAAAIALAVASNIGAVSFTFSASLAGLLWKTILLEKGIKVGQGTFAFWNLLPLAVMTTVGLGIVCAEMAVLYPGVQ
jgi:hypothetical protein